MRTLLRGLDSVPSLVPPSGSCCCPPTCGWASAVKEQGLLMWLSCARLCPLCSTWSPPCTSTSGTMSCMGTAIFMDTSVDCSGPLRAEPNCRMSHGLNPFSFLISAWALYVSSSLHTLQSTVNKPKQDMIITHCLTYGFVLKSKDRPRPDTISCG